IVTVARRRDLGALVCGKGGIARKRQRHEHAQEETSFHDRGSLFLSGAEWEEAALPRRKKLQVLSAAALFHLRLDAIDLGLRNLPGLHQRPAPNRRTIGSRLPST